MIRLRLQQSQDAKARHLNETSKEQTPDETITECTPAGRPRGRNGKQLSVRERRAEGHVVRPGETFPEPEVWFHDLFRMDGTPYDQTEIDLFRELTGRGN